MSVLYGRERKKEYDTKSSHLQLKPLLVKRFGFGFVQELTVRRETLRHRRGNVSSIAQLASGDNEEHQRQNGQGDQAERRSQVAEIAGGKEEGSGEPVNGCVEDHGHEDAALCVIKHPGHHDRRAHEDDRKFRPGNDDAEETGASSIVAWDRE